MVTVVHSNLARPHPDLVARMNESRGCALEASLDSLDNSFPKSSPGVLDTLEESRRAGILPIVSTVATSRTSDVVPLIARAVTERGFAHVTAVYQSVGGMFSSPDESLRPTAGQIDSLFAELREIKRRTHLIRNSWHFLNNPEYHKPKGWHCDPNRTLWLAVDSDGSLMACQEFRTGVSLLDEVFSADAWGSERSRIANSCLGCSYHCYVEPQELTVSALAREAFAWALGVGKLTSGTARLTVRSRPDSIRLEEIPPARK